MSKLTEAQEKFGEKQKLMGELLKQAGEDNDFAKVTVFGDGLSAQENVEKFRALNDELGHLADACKRLELQEAGSRWEAYQTELKTPKPQPAHPSGDAQGKTLGQRLVESEEFKSFKPDHAKGFSVEFPEIELKTLMTTTAGFAPESTRTGRIVDAVTRPIQALDLIPMGQTDAPSIVYMEETLRTHSAAEKLEGAAYAESAFELTERSSQVRKITDSLPVTDEQLEDVSGLASYIDTRLTFGVRQRLDNQVVNGNGTPPNLRGVLQVAGIQTQAKGADPTFDAFHKAMTKVRVTGRSMPNAILVNPFDWEEIRLTRTADGIYILGNPADAGPMRLFGLPVALGDVISAGTGLVGDFANFCQLYEKRGVMIEYGYSGTDFVEGKQHIRASLRAAFVVYRPQAFCTVTGI